MSDSLRETILLIVQIASLVALIVYVVKTADMARETKKSADATEKSIEEMVEDRNLEFAPYVVVYFDAQTDSPIFDLVIKNTGKTIANQVYVTFEPPLQTSLKNYDLKELALLHRPIPALPPGFELRTSLDRLETRLESETLPKLYKVTVTYTGGLSKVVRKLEYILDINMFHGILETHKSSLTDLTHVIEEIPHQLETIPGSLEQISAQVEKLAQTSEKLDTIKESIASLDATVKSKNSKIW